MEKTALHRGMDGVGMNGTFDEKPSGEISPFPERDDSAFRIAHETGVPHVPGFLREQSEIAEQLLKHQNQQAGNVEAPQSSGEVAEVGCGSENQHHADGGQSFCDQDKQGDRSAGKLKRKDGNLRMVEEKIGDSGAENEWQSRNNSEQQNGNGEFRRRGKQKRHRGEQHGSGKSISGKGNCQHKKQNGETYFGQRSAPAEKTLRRRRNRREKTVGGNTHFAVFFLDRQMMYPAIPRRTAQMTAPATPASEVPSGDSLPGIA